MTKWPVLQLRMAKGAPVVTGPTHATFGNQHGVSPEPDLSTDPSASWQWDGTTLHVKTDRYGFFPIFYYANGDDLSISPSLVALLEAGASSELDYTALAVLFRVGFLMGEDTPFEHIRVMPPQGTLRWHQGKLDISGALVTPERGHYTRDAAVDEFIERFRAAITRRPATGYSIMPLSGGRDSRHIFLELLKAKRPPDVAVTIGPLPSFTTNEVETARQVATKGGVPHIAIMAPDSQWTAETKTRRDTHFATFEHWWLQALVDFVAGAPENEPTEVANNGHLATNRTSPAPGSLHPQSFPTSVFPTTPIPRRTVYEGVAGDVLSTFFLKNSDRERLYAEGRLDELAETFLTDEGYLPRLLPPEVYGRASRDAARARVTRELARHVHQPHPLASFLVYNRTRRVTSLSPASMLSPHATVWCPYLDADVFDFLMSLPPAILAGATEQEFHDEAIRRAHPDFANIPFSSKKMTRQTARRYQWQLVKDMTSAMLTGTPWLIRRSLLMPRIGLAAVSTSYWTELFQLASLTNYLDQLSRYTAAPLVQTSPSHNI